MPVRIGLNARLLASDDRRGFNRYAAELSRALQASGRADVVLFSDAPIHPSHQLRHLETVVAPVRPQWRWQHAWLPKALRAARIDCFHAPAHWGIPWRSHCPVVATIHDLAGRERRRDFASASLRARLRHGLEERLVRARAARIITVSSYSAASIARHFRLPNGRVAVTVEGAADAFVRARLAPSSAPAPEPYFVVVGGFDPRKNLGLIVHALAALPPEERVSVRFVGGRSGEAERLAQTARAAGVEAWTPLLGRLSDEELVEQLARAVALLMPSYLEGFGLPVVEAMHAGTPCVVSSAGALPEIAGDAALIIPVDDHHSLAAAMRRLVTEPGLRAALAARARARAAQFTWERAAEQTLVVYEDVIKRSKGGA